MIFANLSHYYTLPIFFKSVDSNDILYLPANLRDNFAEFCGIKKVKRVVFLILHGQCLCDTVNRVNMPVTAGDSEQELSTQRMILTSDNVVVINAQSFIHVRLSCFDMSCLKELRSPQLPLQLLLPWSDVFLARNLLPYHIFRLVSSQEVLCLLCEACCYI